MPLDKKRASRLFAKLNNLLQQVAHEATADHVHYLRTNTRRAEALLMAHGITRSSQGKLFKQLGRFRKRAGKVRDIDVQIAALASIQTESQYEHKQRVLDALRRRRAKSSKKLVALLVESGADLKKRLQKSKVKLFNRQDVEEDSATDFYQFALESFRKSAERHCIHVGAATDPERLHKFRLAAKRARYYAELAGEGPQARALAKDLERIQDAIGDWHDWRVLHETAVDELKDLRASRLLSILENMVGAKFTSAVRATSEVTKKLLQHPPEGLLKKRPTSAMSAQESRRIAAGF